MAEFFVRGQRFVISPELYTDRIPRMSDHALHQSVVDIGEIAVGCSNGEVSIALDGLRELRSLQKKLVFEIEWRKFSRSCGITLEVR